MLRSPGPRGRSTSAAAPSGRRCEVECLPGLEAVVAEEIAALLPGRSPQVGRARPGRLTLEIERPWVLEDLRCAVAVHLSLLFEVPRPKALLGHQHFQRLLNLAREVTGHHPAGAFSAVRISAAGADSAVFVRLKAELERELGLPGRESEGKGDLLLAFRRSTEAPDGWEVLARTSPRPLSARPWRVCPLPGALNATVAQAMVRLAQPRPHDRFLNLACGSGTLLVERLQTVPARLAFGLDRSGEALDCARANLRAAGVLDQVGLLHADAASLPLPAASIDTLVVDLPFGMLVGSARENRDLYPALLQEATRVAAPEATMVAVTAARRLFEATLRRRSAAWWLRRTLPVRLPFNDREMVVGIYLLQRR